MRNFVIIVIISHFLLQTWNRSTNFTIITIYKSSHYCRVVRRNANPHFHCYVYKTGAYFTILITVLVLAITQHDTNKTSVWITCDWTTRWPLKILVIWNVTLSQDKYFSKFQRSWHLLNISNLLPDDTTSHSTRLESSATVLREPHILQVGNYLLELWPKWIETGMYAANYRREWIYKWMVFGFKPFWVQCT
jgi:hypothetical protein